MQKKIVFIHPNQIVLRLACHSGLFWLKNAYKTNRPAFNRNWSSVACSYHIAKQLLNCKFQQSTEGLLKVYPL